MNKVFGIGLSKTGTTSLYHALSTLGYSIIDNPSLEQIVNLKKYDGATDVGAASHFKFLDSKYLNSKFIYTIRDRKSWLLSTENHWKNMPFNSLPEHAKVNRLFTYYQVEYDREHFWDVYVHHEQEVLRYFANRSNFLILNICGGEGWDKLLLFLGKKGKFSHFPHKNRSNY